MTGVTSQSGGHFHLFTHVISLFLREASTLRKCQRRDRTLSGSAQIHDFWGQARMEIVGQVAGTEVSLQEKASMSQLEKEIEFWKLRK